MQSRDEPSPVIFKYPLGDQARHFHFACGRGASRLYFSAAEQYAFGVSGVPVAVMPDPATNVVPMTSAIPTAKSRAGQSA